MVKYSIAIYLSKYHGQFGIDSRWPHLIEKNELTILSMCPYVVHVTWCEFYTEKSKAHLKRRDNANDLN